MQSMQYLQVIVFFLKNANFFCLVYKNIYAKIYTQAPEHAKHVSTQARQTRNLADSSRPCHLVATIYQSRVSSL